MVLDLRPAAQRFRLSHGVSERGYERGGGPGEQGREGGEQAALLHGLSRRIAPAPKQDPQRASLSRFEGSSRGVVAATDSAARGAGQCLPGWKVTGSSMVLPSLTSLAFTVVPGFTSPSTNIRSSTLETS